MKEKKALEATVDHLASSNQSIKEENKQMKLSNHELRDLVAIQNQRLEKLEQIALVNEKDQKTASSFFSLSNFFSTIKGYFPVSK